MDGKRLKGDTMNEYEEARIKELQETFNVDRTEAKRMLYHIEQEEAYGC